MVKKKHYVVEVRSNGFRHIAISYGSIDLATKDATWVVEVYGDPEEYEIKIYCSVC